MPTVEMNTASTEGDQKEKMSPSEEGSPPVLNHTTAPLNFPELTPHQFGISVQSFTAASLSNRKDKSCLAQMKAGRRTSIGVRGSPETNSLIRFMAQQRMKTPPTFQTPELVRSSPFFPRVASTLRQKMASFQNLLDVEESEICDPMPKQDSNTGGCIKTRDYLSDGNSHDEGKENHPPILMLIPSKRRHLGPLEDCKVEIREASSPILHFSLKEQEQDEEAVTQVVTQGPLPSSENVEESQAMILSPPLHVDFACSSTENNQDGVFELQSPSRPPPDEPAAASSAQPASLFHILSLPSLLEMKPTGEDDTVKKKKKRVCFGGPLSPEFFDKNLPPSTPLQKGGTPARAPTPGVGLQLHSALKTPQRTKSQTPQAQPDLSSPTEFGTSPTLAMTRHRRIQSVGEDREEKDEKIVFPSMEEIDSAVASDTDCMWDAQPLNLNSAFHEEFLSHILTESVIKPSMTSQMDVLDAPTSLPEKEKQLEAGVEAPAQSRNRREKPGTEHESTREAPACFSSRKRKQPEENEPGKRSTRSAAKLASERMKLSSTATRRWNRDVDRSLYGPRMYASKKPTLSPIIERLLLTNQSPAAQQYTAMSCTESVIKPSMTSQMDVLDAPTSLSEKQKQLEAGVEAPAQSRNRREKPEENEPGKRSTRSAAKLASERMKLSSTATSRWNRDVDRSLYGSRAYASKNVSPITERLLLTSQSPAAKQYTAMSCTGVSIISPISGKESTTCRLSRPRIGGRGLKKWKGSVSDGLLFCEVTLDQTGGKAEEHCEDQTTTNLEASRETPLTHIVPKQGGVDAEFNAQTSANTHCTDSDGKLQRLDTLISDCPPSGEESNNTMSLPVQRETRRGRRSSVNRSLLQEQGNQAEEHQMSHEVEEKKQAHEAASQQGNDIRSSSDGKEGGVVDLDLAPWQGDFNFEYVFKPVASREQLSVRRSLRNKSKEEHSRNTSRLSWLP